MKEYIPWRLRGIGRSGGWNSLVTGRNVRNGPDMSGFVTDRATAYRLAELLSPVVEGVRYEDRCYVDFRPSEPHWLQVKVIVEEEHEAVLQRLYDAVSLRDMLIRASDVQWAIDPTVLPGTEPAAYRTVQYWKNKADQSSPS